MSKINADTYDAEIVFIFGGKTLYCPNIRVCNVGSQWLVDADSFVLATGLKLTQAILYQDY